MKVRLVTNRVTNHPLLKMERVKRREYEEKKDKQVAH